MDKQACKPRGEGLADRGRVRPRCSWSGAEFLGDCWVRVRPAHTVTRRDIDGASRRHARRSRSQNITLNTSPTLDHFKTFFFFEGQEVSRRSEHG